MNLTLLIYLIGVIDDIRGILVILGGVGFLILGFLLIPCLLADNKYSPKDDAWDTFYKKASGSMQRENIFKLHISLIIICIFMFLLSTFIPSSKTLTTMYLVPKIAQSGQIGQLNNISKNGIDILNLKLEEWKTDLVRAE